MDTRKKILGLEEVLARTEGIKVRWVRGSFDPLLAAHARTLDKLASADAKIAVLLRDPPDALLTSRARSELVAALRAVDYVSPDGPIPESTAIEDIDSLAVRSDFESYVRRRNKRIE